MKIFVRTEKREEFCCIEATDGMTLEDVANSAIKTPRYRILAAIVNNSVRMLTEEIHEGDKITFIDMRTQAANLIYQSSLIMIYIRAIKTVFGESADAEIRNTINKGLYTVIKASKDANDKDIKSIEAEMKRIVAAKMPFITNSDSTVTLDGYTAQLATQTVPNSGYIEYFEVRKYRRGVLVRFPHPNNPNISTRLSCTRRLGKLLVGAS